MRYLFAGLLLGTPVMLSQPALAADEQIAVLHLTVSDSARAKMDADALASIESGLTDTVHTVLPPEWHITDSDQAVDLLEKKGVDMSTLDVNDAVAIAKAMQVDYVVTGELMWSDGFTGTVKVVPKTGDVRREEVQADSAAALRVRCEAKGAEILSKLVASFPGERPLATTPPVAKTAAVTEAPPPVETAVADPAPAAPTPPAPEAQRAEPPPPAAPPPPPAPQAPPQPAPSGGQAYAAPQQSNTAAPPVATPAGSDRINDSHQFEELLAGDGQWMDIPGVGHVWSPNPALVGPDFRPYASNGHWVYTSFGWTFESGYSWGWAAFHYGRWWHHAVYGWVWLPGTTWGPAWVDWRASNGVVGWRPTPPVGLYAPPVVAGFTPWCFVETRYLVEPNVAVYAMPHDRVTYYYGQAQPIYVERSGGTVTHRWSPGVPVNVVSRAAGRPIVAQPVPVSARPRTAQAVRLQTAVVRSPNYQRQTFSGQPYRPASQPYRAPNEPYRQTAQTQPYRAPNEPYRQPAQTQPYRAPNEPYRQPAPSQPYRAPNEPYRQPAPAQPYRAPAQYQRPAPAQAHPGPVPRPPVRPQPQPPKKKERERE